jgi:hypothetical protein
MVDTQNPTFPTTTKLAWIVQIVERKWKFEKETSPSAMVFIKMAHYVNRRGNKKKIKPIPITLRPTKRRCDMLEILCIHNHVP